MAQIQNNKGYKIEDLYNVNKEQELVKLCVDIALASTDKSWNKHDTNDPQISINYKLFPTDNLYTVRAEMQIENASIEQYYEFSEAGYNDLYQCYKELNEKCTEYTCLQSIDIDHEIVYSSYDSETFAISPRDFCYIKARHKLTDYQSSDGALYDIVTILCYSVDKKHPFYCDTKKNHVRGIFKYVGYIYIKDKSSNTNSCRVCYVILMDPGGWVPTWIFNQVVADKGMDIKSMQEVFPKITRYLETRRQNNNKRDREFLVDQNDHDDDIQQNILDTLRENTSEKKEMKQCDNHVSNVTKPRKGTALQFEIFLKKHRLHKYYQAFKQNECNDIRDVEYLIGQQEFIKNNVGIVHPIDRGRLLGEANKLKIEMDSFKVEYGMSSIIIQRLSEHGIVTMDILCNEIRNKSDLSEKYKFNMTQTELLWNIIQKQLNTNGDNQNI